MQMVNNFLSFIACKRVCHCQFCHANFEFAAEKFYTVLPENVWHEVGTFPEPMYCKPCYFKLMPYANTPHHPKAGPFDGDQNGPVSQV